MAGGRLLSEENADEILARAHAAVAALKEGYREQLVQDVETLRACLRELEAGAPDGEHPLQELFVTSHNVKGQAGTFGYDLITSISELLCEFLRAKPALSDDVVLIVRAHVDALSLLVDHDVEGSGGALGTEVVEKLKRLQEAA
jgi:chemotaxis protein histidine kinase CheA